MDEKLRKLLLEDVSYHDADVLKVEQNNDYILTFEDGWNSNQVNEMIFVNCKSEIDLNDKEFYQLEDVKYTDGKMDVTISYWGEHPVFADEARLIADNIIIKVYYDGVLNKETSLKELL